MVTLRPYYYYIFVVFLLFYFGGVGVGDKMLCM